MEKLFQVSEEKLFQVLEEKLMLLLSEREDLIRNNQSLHQENATLKKEKEINTQKLEVLISLLNSVDIQEKSSLHVNDMASNHMNVATKPILVQG